MTPLENSTVFSPEGRESMLSNGVIWLLSRTIDGLGDHVMCEPLISIASERVKSPLIKGGRGVVNDDTLWWQGVKAYYQIFEYHPSLDKLFHEYQHPEHENIRHILNIHDGKSCPCAAYEAAHEPLIKKSRQALHCEAAGFAYDNRPPRLYFSPDELNEIESLNRKYPGPCIGIQYRTKSRYRDYPYMNILVDQLKRQGYHVFIFDNMTDFSVPGGIMILNRPIREVMRFLRGMTVFIGLDSGLSHIAGALKVPCFILSFTTDPEVRFASYGSHMEWNKRFPYCRRSYCWYHPCAQRFCAKTCSPYAVVKKIKKMVADNYDAHLKVPAEIIGSAKSKIWECEAPAEQKVKDENSSYWGCNARLISPNRNSKNFS